MPTADEQYFVSVVLPGQTQFVTAGRFALRRDRRGDAVGGFVYGRRYRERVDVVELDPALRHSGARLSPRASRRARRATGAPL